MNARLILDIFYYCDETNEDGILLFLDFKKAFDSVEWSFLNKTLHKFNFGNNVINWVSILYRNPILAHLNRRLERAIVIAHRPSSVRP